MASKVSDIAQAVKQGVHTTRWGILATGWIASVFTKDLLADPQVRGVTDIRHEVVAVGSSTSVESAKDFISKYGLPKVTKAYGSYEALVNDPSVDIIYIATPHSHHFQNAMLALRAGKPVLVEKAFTVNAAQARILMSTAKAANLFLMEAVWTRYFPLCTAVQDLVTSGKIGSIQRVFADFSFGEDVESKWGTKSRVVNMDLAGGSLLDLGPYALMWVFQILYHLQEGPKEKPRVVSSMVKYEGTGADEQTSVLLTFPKGVKTDGGEDGKRATQGIATCGLRVGNDPDGRGSSGPAVKIQGTKGEIQILGPPYRPTSYKLIPKIDAESGKPVGSITKIEEVNFEVPGPGLEKGGHGMYWEADEAARCLRDGKLQSEKLDWEETLAVMETMDMIREQNGIVYPNPLETTEYPFQLPI